MTLIKPRSVRRPSSRYHWLPAVAGWTVGVIATVSLLASLSPLIRWLIHEPREFINSYLFNFPDTSFAWSFVLALLAAALTARKRIAWVVLLGNMVVSAGINAADIAAGGNTPAEAFGENLGFAFHIVATVLLVLGYREFWAKVRRGALFRAAAVLVVGGAIGILASWALVEMFPGTLAPQDRLPYVANRVIGFGLIDSDVFTGRPHVFLNAIFGLFGAFALIAAAIVLFLSQRADNALTGEDESAIRGLVELYGKNDSLAYFATRRDKSVIFAPSGRAAITYRVEVGVCLASGDPVGDPKAWPQAIDAWLRLCQTYGWAPGVMGASSQGAQVFREAGLNALVLGDEAILRPAEYKLSGPEMRGVRQAVTRARRAGLTVRIRRHRDISPDEMAKTVERADAWRDTETERGFSMALGRLGDPADADCLLVEAVNPGGEVVAMLSLVPWGRHRRFAGPDAPITGVTQRHHRADGQRADAARRKSGHQPNLVEFRRFPLGIRAGRAARRGTGSAVVAWPAGVLLAVVAAGNPLPLQRQVSTRMGAPLRLLRGRPDDPAGRRRLGDRRGLPSAAVQSARQGAHRSSPRRAGAAGGDRLVAP